MRDTTFDRGMGPPRGASPRLNRPQASRHRASARISHPKPMFAAIGQVRRPASRAPYASNFERFVEQACPKTSPMWSRLAPLSSPTVEQGPNIPTTLTTQGCGTILAYPRAVASVIW